MREREAAANLLTDARREARPLLEQLGRLEQRIANAERGGVDGKTETDEASRAWRERARASGLLGNAPLRGKSSPTGPPRKVPVPIDVPRGLTRVSEARLSRTKSRGSTVATGAA